MQNKNDNGFWGSAFDFVKALLDKGQIGMAWFVIIIIPLFMFTALILSHMRKVAQMKLKELNKGLAEKDEKVQRVMRGKSND